VTEPAPFFVVETERILSLHCKELVEQIEEEVTECVCKESVEVGVNAASVGNLAKLQIAQRTSLELVQLVYFAETWLFGVVKHFLCFCFVSECNFFFFETKERKGKEK
jgi:hypothetical protein